MIPLFLQLKLLLFSFIYGIIIYLSYRLCNKFIYDVKVFFRVINTFTLVLGITLIYFYIIEKFMYGVFHIYSLLVILLSFTISSIIANRNKK